MRNPEFTNQFKKDYKRMIKQGREVNLLDDVAEQLIDEKVLHQKHRDHNLKGKLLGSKECHIQGDWLLIYSIDGNAIIFERTGSHAELFKS